MVYVMVTNVVSEEHMQRVPREGVAAMIINGLHAVQAD